MKLPEDADISMLYGGLQLNLVLEKSKASLQVEIKGFNTLDILWLSKIYRTYEGQVWSRIVINKKCKKFHCLMCDKTLCSFTTLRSHINIHLEIYPFKCSDCERSYASNASLYKHCRAKKHECCRQFID